MAIKTLIIEHRPRLQSANFFIRFGAEIESSQERIEVVLRESSVAISKRQIEGGGHDNKDLEDKEIVSKSSTRGVLEISTAGHLDVLTNSLSSLVARDGYLSFRVNTNSKSFGVELLSLTDCCDRLQEGRFERAQVNVLAGKRYEIRCVNCTRDLGRGEWRRIFELPSGNFEAGDWFCHGSVNFNVTSPKEEELFYGYYYAVVNQKVLEGDRVKLAGRLVHCKRCLRFLGEKTGKGGCGEGSQGDSEGIKLWNENVKVVEEGEGETKDSVTILKSKSLVGTFQNLIRKIVIDFEFVDKFTSLLPTMHKILVKSYRTDSSKEVPSVYLLVQVMEMSLDVLQWVEGSLKKQQAMKLLYCLVDVSTAGKDDQLFKYWDNDQNVHPLQVSPKMFEDVLGCLRENSQLIPEVYRFSFGFELSYIFAEEE